MSSSRIDQLKQVSAKLFREIHVNSMINKRTGERILMERPVGPDLKSYWPNKVRDIVDFGRRRVSSEIPLHSSLLGDYALQISQSQKSLPISLHHVSRENIADWRKRRGGLIKKGETKVTTTAMGKKK